MLAFFYEKHRKTKINLFTGNLFCFNFYYLKKFEPLVILVHQPGGRQYNAGRSYQIARLGTPLVPWASEPLLRIQEVTRTSMAVVGWLLVVIPKNKAKTTPPPTMRPKSFGAPQQQTMESMRIALGTITGCGVWRMGENFRAPTEIVRLHKSVLPQLSRRGMPRETW
jgi:hypothetical protein